MKRLILILAILIPIAVLLPTRAGYAARSPLVLAFYYDWYDQNTWTPSKVADMPVAPYTSSDPTVAARQIQQARGAGIDAFVVSWWGAGNPTDTNFKILLDQASRTNFQVAIDFEVTSPFYHSVGDATNSLKNLLATYAQNPAYLHADGKPVIFFWREQNYSPDAWTVIRNSVDPNHTSLWIAEGDKSGLPYLPVFDGFHLYSIAWAPDVTAELAKWPPRVKSYGADKIWVATTMPGNDNTRANEPDPYVRDRQNGDFYRATWQAAFNTMPDWIIITSWNEWREGTMIEPSVTYGNLYLDITRAFAAQFHAGLPTPTPTNTPTPTLTPTPTTVPPPDATDDAPEVGIHATITTSDTLRVRADPNTEAAILGRLQPGASVTIVARNDDSTWWQIPYPDSSQRGWIDAEFVTVDGDTSSLPIAGSAATLTPEATDTSEPTPSDTATPSPTATPSDTPTLTATPEATGTPSPTPQPTAPSLLQQFFGWLPFH